LEGAAMFLFERSERQKQRAGAAQISRQGKYV